ncbi:uncharacterized protein E5676_scaffold83G001990 [Cucumis melo var. makuwa]|uniref:Uncharacterized protein n=1 Tax=Cucumis melo var. makuwa TaxID=1194695 RepID=A0A5D3C2A9_CUCMM|nr:uncharacterized protein E5676_scaffold83G001990 [Cucumis melo var. makuwa]
MCKARDGHTRYASRTRVTPHTVRLAHSARPTSARLVHDKVDKFLFFADFLILNYEVDREEPIILRWSFLSTGHALTNIHQGELTSHFNEKEVKFNIVNAIKLFPADDENCSVIVP